MALLLMALCGAFRTLAQETPAAALADAPAPQVDGQSSNQDSTGAQVQSSDQVQQPAAAEQTQEQKAHQQVQEEEQQRILGVLPNFGTTYRSDAVSLTAGQKIGLAFRSATDPATFGISFIVAGYHEANDDYPEFGWGAEGYFKRAGAAYLDAFDGAMIGNGILPAIFHQDPRYFRLGHGSTVHRTLYAMSTTFMCKHDNSRRWEPNYSNVGGNLIAGAISNLYYPGQNSGWEQTVESGLIVTVEGMAGGVFDEFWPDISRKLFHKDPTHGLDAQARETDASDKKKQPLGTEPK
ncbi:MAG TPA: hypothetical protein VKB38_07795 [Terracidiphilus sp.]|nr:hypothetical protein [Terracidiphilus sp.]